MTIPYFAPPEWAWYLRDPADTDDAPTYLTALTAATGRQLSFIIDSIATAQFTMPGASDAPLDAPHPETQLVKELATDLYVTRNGRPVFRGRIGASSETHSAAQDSIQFTAFDYRGMLDHRVIWPTSTLEFGPPNGPDIDQVYIAWQLIADSQGQPGGDLGIIQGTGIAPTGQTRVRVYTPGVPLGQTLNDLATSPNGFEWDIDASRQFNIYHPTRGRDQTNVGRCVLVYGRGVSAVTRTVNPDSYANAVFYTGSQPETLPVADMLGTFPAGVGRWEMQKTDPNARNAQTVEDQAMSTLVSASQLEASYAVTLAPAWWEPDDIWLGDLVQIVVQDGRLDINVPRRVTEVQVSLDDDGTESVVLSVSPKPAPGTVVPADSGLSSDKTTDASGSSGLGGGAGTIPRLSRRLRSTDDRMSKLELVVATAGGGATEVFTGDPPPTPRDDYVLWIDPNETGGGGGGGGGGLPPWFQYGAGPPYGVVTPAAPASLYWDTTNAVLYQANSEGNTDWFVLGGQAYAGEGTIPTAILATPGGEIDVSGTPNTSDNTVDVDGYINGISLIAYGSPDVPGTTTHRSRWLLANDASLGLADQALDGNIGTHLYATASGAPDVLIGEPGDWCLSSDGTIYKKISVSGVQSWVTQSPSASVRDYGNILLTPGSAQVILTLAGPSAGTYSIDASVQLTGAGSAPEAEAWISDAGGPLVSGACKFPSDTSRISLHTLYTATGPFTLRLVVWSSGGSLSVQMVGYLSGLLGTSVPATNLSWVKIA